MIKVVLVAICISSVFYVYRLPFPGFTLSPFRVLFPVLAVMAIVEFGSGRFRINHRFTLLSWILAGIFVINLFDYFRLNDSNRLGVNIANHLTHMAIVPLVVMICSSRESAFAIAVGMISASVMCLAIDAYWLVTGRLPLADFVAFAQGGSMSLADVNVSFAGVPRLASAFFDPSFYGLFIVLSLVMLLFLGERIGSPLFRWALFFLSSVALLLTMSRTSYVGLIVLLSIAVVLLRQVRRPLLRLGLVSVAAAAVYIVAGDHETMTALIARIAELGDMGSRAPYHIAGVEAWQRAPLIGMGSDGLLELQQKYWFTMNSSAHMVYLTWLAKYGLVGFLCYLAFLVLPLIHVVRHWSSLEQKGRFLILGTMLPLMVMYIAYDYFEALEFQYIMFGLVYSVFVHNLWFVDDRAEGEAG